MTNTQTNESGTYSSYVGTDLIADSDSLQGAVQNLADEFNYAFTSLYTRSYPYSSANVRGWEVLGPEDQHVGTIEFFPGSRKTPIGWMP